MPPLGLQLNLTLLNEFFNYHQNQFKPLVPPVLASEIFFLMLPYIITTFLLTHYCRWSCFFYSLIPSKLICPLLFPTSSPSLTSLLHFTELFNSSLSPRYRPSWFQVCCSSSSIKKKTTFDPNDPASSRLTSHWPFPKVPERLIASCLSNYSIIKTILLTILFNLGEPFSIQF